MAAKSKAVQALEERADATDAKLDTILAAVSGSSQPEQTSEQTASKAEAAVPATDVPTALLSERTQSGQGFSLGATVVTQERKDGTTRQHRRVYFVPTQDGSTPSSDQNQFGLLRAKSLHPAVVRLIAENPRDAIKLAEWAEQQQK